MLNISMVLLVITSMLQLIVMTMILTYFNRGGTGLDSSNNPDLLIHEFMRYVHQIIRF